MLLIVAGAAVLLRFAYWLDYRSSPLFDTAAGPDVVEYHDWAVSILNGHWLWPQVPLHGPGYAFVLAFWYALTGAALPAVRLIQLLLGVVGLFVLSSAVGRRCGAPAGHGTAVVWALHIPLIYYEAELFAESLAVFLHAIILSLLLLAQQPVERWVCGVVGLLLGLSIITHPTSLLFAVLLAVWLFRDAWRAGERARCWVNPVVTALSAAVFVAPVALYNSKLSGGFVLVQRHDGLNFYIGNNPDADGTPNVRFGPAWDRLLQMPRREARVVDEHDRRAFYYDKGLEYIKESPGQWLGLLCRKFALVLNAREVTASTPIEAVRPDVALLRLPAFGFAIVLALAAIGLLRRGRELSPVWLLVLAYVASGVLFLAAGRYRVPMLPALFVLAGAGIEVLWSGRRDGWRRMARRAWPAPVALVITLLPVVPASNDDPAEAALARATAHLKRERWTAAVAELETAVELRPDHVPSRINLGQTLDRLGRRREALPHFRAAGEAAPDDAWTQAALAWALAERGDADGALQHYARSIENDPAYAFARLEYARLLKTRGALRRAADHLRFYMRLNPADDGARRDFVDVLLRIGEHAEAAEQLQAGLAARPRDVEYLERLARLRAACPRAELRDANAALKLARAAAAQIDLKDVLERIAAGRPVENAHAGRVLDTLGMAYAASGAFDHAIKSATSAAALAERRQDYALHEQINARLELYRQRRAYREDSP